MASRKKHVKQRASGHSSLNARKHQNPVWILEGIAGALLMLGYMLTLSPFHKRIALLAFFAAYVIAGLGVVVKLYPEFSLSDKLDKRPSAPLGPTPTPKTSLTATPKQATAPIPTPQSIGQSPNQIIEKVAAAQPLFGGQNKLGDTYIGTRVDWVLYFFSSRTNEGQLMPSATIFFRESEGSFPNVCFVVSTLGSLQSDLQYDRTQRFRVTGAIESIDGQRIHLTEANFEPINE
jgi:hypothetical protein